jgi:hypothetical protein
MPENWWQLYEGEVDERERERRITGKRGEFEGENGGGEGHVSVVD